MAKQIINRGVISPVSILCEKCGGGQAMYQEWVEPDSSKNYHRYGIIFCQNCDHKTKIHKERTQSETRQECFYEWKQRNEAIKKYRI